MRPWTRAVTQPAGPARALAGLLVAGRMCSACCFLGNPLPVPDQGVDRSPPPPGGGSIATPTAMSCRPGGYEATPIVAPMPVMHGCRLQLAGSLAAPGVIRSQAELDALVTCDDGAARPEIDFARHEIRRADFVLSPASRGVAIVDDGSVVTFIHQEVSPCPGAPHVMPTPVGVTFLLPAGASRRFEERTCTIPSRCD